MEETGRKPNSVGREQRLQPHISPIGRDPTAVLEEVPRALETTQTGQLKLCGVDLNEHESIVSSFALLGTSTEYPGAYRGAHPLTKLWSIDDVSI